MELVARRSYSGARLRLAHVELLVLAGAAPLLLFPRGALAWLGLALLPLAWVIRGLATGRWFARTPLDRPVAIIFLMALVSLFPSGDLTLSMPKFYGILLGLFVFYFTVTYVSSQRRFWLGVGLLVTGLVAISIVGLVGTEWEWSKYSALQQAYSSIPRLIRGAESSVGLTAGFHPNELGGTLIFLLPLPLALAFGAPLPLKHRGILVATSLLGLGVLVLSASRSSLVGFAVGALALLIWRSRRIGLGLLAVIAAAFLVALSLDAPTVAGFLTKVDAANAVFDRGSLPVRLEIWDRARRMIEDFPFTGIGLNTFPVILDTLYPASIAGLDARIPHAHNIYLQTAVDLGIGGLLAFLGLWALVAGAGRRAYRQIGMGSAFQLQVRAAIAGLLVGFLSFLVYGLTDAITLGAKPTVLLWIMMGLVVAAQNLGPRPSTGGVDVSGSTSGSQAGRLMSLATVVWGSYWVLAYCLVGLGYLVLALAVLA